MQLFGVGGAEPERVLYLRGLSEIPAPDSPLSRITRKFGLVLRSHRFCLCVA
jgi:hypothetical protein